MRSSYFAYLENQILRNRIEEIQSLISESEIDKAVEATHKNTKEDIAERVRVMIMKSKTKEGANDEQK